MSPPADSTASATNRLVSLHARPKVLLAEDETISQVLAAETLKALACAVVIVADGEAAVKQAAQEPFDLILMDCELPGIDGLEATRQIRQRTADSCAIPIIALTGNDEEDDRRRCLAAGMNGFLAKPISLKTLGEILQRHLPQHDVMVPPVGAGGTMASPFDGAAPLSPELIIDRKALDSIRALQRPQAPNLVARVINNFFCHASKLLSAIEQGLRNSDAAAVKDAAHGLKSSAATVGATALAEQSKRLEKLARQGDLRTAGAALSQLQREYQKANSALSQASSQFDR